MNETQMNEMRLEGCRAVADVAVVAKLLSLLLLLLLPLMLLLMADRRDKF